MNNTSQPDQHILLPVAIPGLLVAALVEAGPAWSSIFSIRGLALLVVLAFASLVLVSVSSWLAQFIRDLLPESSPWRHRRLLPGTLLLFVNGVALLPLLLAAWALEFNYGRQGLAATLLLVVFELAWIVVLESPDQQPPDSTENSRHRG